MKKNLITMLRLEMSGGKNEKHSALRDITSHFERRHSSPALVMKLMMFVTVARKLTLEFTPAWLPVPVGRQVGVECSQSKVKSLCVLLLMHNEQHMLTLK